MSRSREFLTIIAAIAACFVLIALIQKPETQEVSSRSVERPRRDTAQDDDDEEDDASCQDFQFGSEDCLEDADGAKTSGSEEDSNSELARRGKGNKKKPQVQIDINSDSVMQQIQNLNRLLKKRVAQVDQRAPKLSLAEPNPDTVRPGNWPNNINEATATALGETCAAGADNRISANTKALYLLYPKDMAFMDKSETGIDNAELLDIYMDFFTKIADNTAGAENTYFGNYAANSFIKVGSSLNAPEAFAYSQRSGNLRVLQPDLGKTFIRFVTTIRKHARRDMSSGLGDQCSAIIIIHTLPKDYKDFNTQEFDTGFQSKCTVIPVFVAPTSDLVEQFQSMAAAFHRNAVNQFKVASESEMNPYHVLDAGHNLANKMNRLADAIPSYLCALENRVQCDICGDAYIPAMSTTSFPVSESSAWPDTTTISADDDEFGGWREADTTTSMPWTTTVLEEEVETPICCSSSPDAVKMPEVGCMEALP